MDQISTKQKTSYVSIQDKMASKKCSFTCLFMDTARRLKGSGH